MNKSAYASALCLCFYLHGTPCSIAQDISGAWQNVEFLGLSSVENKCSFITVRDYRYTFSPERDGLRGAIFSTADSKLWVTVTDPDCAFPGETSDQKTYLRFSQWDGLARATGPSRWEIGTAPGRCSMQGCAEVSQDLASISSEVESRDSLLFDKRGGMPPGFPSIPFRRLDAAERLAEDAANALPGLMKGLDEGNCFNWYQTAWSSLAIDASKIPALCVLEKQTEQSTGQVMETRVAGSWTLGLDARQPTGQASNVVLIAAAAVLGNGTNLGRIAVLTQQQGSWQILQRFGR